MSIDYRILPDMGLVFVRYAGLVELGETMTMFKRFMADPLCGQVHRHLIDLKDVRAIAFDFPGLLRLQAKKAEHLSTQDTETLMAYYATTPDTLKMARMAQRSWDGLSQGLIARSFDDEAAVKTFLGVPRLDIAALRVTVAG